MTNKIRNIRVLNYALLVSVTALLVVSCYTDYSVDSGEGYGFRIGDDKSETFIKARIVLGAKATYVLSPIDSEGFGPHKKIEFNNEDFILIRDRDKWDFYFGSGYNDSLKLKFSDGRLTNIHRHKQSIELP